MQVVVAVPIYIRERHRVAQREAAVVAVLEVQDITRLQLATLLRRRGLQTPEVEEEERPVIPPTSPLAQEAPASSSLLYQGVDDGPLC
jgi:hypothetical protein